MRERWLGRLPYAGIEAAMREFTLDRDESTTDELWLIEHEPVFTQGIGGRDVHVLDAGGVPVVRTGRGGQVTFHGPGQIVAYPLVDLRRLGLYVKEYVFRLEQSVIDTLLAFGITGHRVKNAPGICVRLDDPAGHARLERDAALPGAFDGLGKIAALGVKVSRHRSYHGLALNVAMDLAPFARIDPCGYARLATTDMKRCGVEVSLDAAAKVLAQQLQRLLGR